MVQIMVQLVGHAIEFLVAKRLFPTLKNEINHFFLKDPQMLCRYF